LTVGFLPVTTADDNAPYCADLVAGLADAGVDIVFISPGSRNTPLTLAFAAEPRIRDLSIRDERSAGFTAVGYGKATGRPAVVVCTSGSAATHYFPAIVESNQSAVPLIVLTADRPTALRGTFAPQTMDQIDLYGSHVKVFTDLPVGAETGRGDGHDLVEASLTLPCGPVHANAPFDEPLVPISPTRLPSPDPSIPPHSPVPPQPEMLKRLAGRNVLIVAGGRQRSGFGEVLNEVAKKLAAPILADPQCWVTGANTIAHGDLLATSRAPFESHRPDVVLRLGPLPTSKPLWNWLERSGVEQILVHSSRLRDPLGTATTVVDCDPTLFLRSSTVEHKSDETFLNGWRDMDVAVGSATDHAMEQLPFPNEPEIARTLVAAVPRGSIIYVGSSMPVRELDTFAVPRSDIRVLANRGVNGIDGTISSALGCALSGHQVTLLLGDITALHDATALSEVARLGAPLRLIVINNDGGGIFSFLPQARSDHVDAATFEKHWGTPHGLSLATIADAFSMTSVVVDDHEEFTRLASQSIESPQLIELTTDRDSNVQYHQSIRTAAKQRFVI
jgi:2-succinyl-5-enolpyruvyl-6-hydroxy-3-cyclohexene-1-carboxylate synthase